MNIITILILKLDTLHIIVLQKKTVKWINIYSTEEFLQ
jgi:hypothetical protein